MKRIYKDYTGLIRTKPNQFRPVRFHRLFLGFFFSWNGQTATESPFFSGPVWSQSSVFPVLWTGLLIPRPIRKFHLANHINSCFSKWSLNFMKGAGHINGEIIETLWSGMNKVSGGARLMSKAHRQVTLDDYVRDSNWKKTVGIGKLFFAHTIFNYYIIC